MNGISLSHFEDTYTISIEINQLLLDLKVPHSLKSVSIFVKALSFLYSLKV